MIVKLPVVVRLPLSVTEQFTVCGEPLREKKLPLARVQVGVSAPSSVSLALAEYVTFAPPRVFPSTVMLAGRLSEGAVFGGVHPEIST